jgi:hypothetical protein
MIASLLITAEIPLQKIREKEQPQNGKHDEKLDQDDPPQFPAPGHSPESIIIEPENFSYHLKYNNKPN